MKDLLSLKTACSGTLHLNGKHFPEMLKPQSEQSTARRGACTMLKITVFDGKKTKMFMPHPLHILTR